MNYKRHFSIMILEDNSGDVVLLKRALQRAEIDFTAVVFEDGESAFRYIDSQGAPEVNPKLDAAILDLNVPKRDGSEVLAHIRQSPELRDMRTIVLSSSPTHVMVDRAAQADCYITKPSTLAEYLLIGGSIKLCLESVPGGSISQGAHP